MIYSILFTNLVALSPVTPPATLSGPVPDSGVTYTVPALEGMEAPLTFGIENAKFKKRSGTALLSFRLPAMLTGTEDKIFKLKGAVDGTSINMQGEGANAVCNLIEAATECQIKFDPLKIDHARSDLLLKDNVSESLAKAIRVGRQAFEHQAVGVIRFENTGDEDCTEEESTLQSGC